MTDKPGQVNFRLNFVRKNSSLMKKRNKRNKSLKATSICLAVVLNFIVFWVPHCVHDVMQWSEHSTGVHGGGGGGGHGGGGGEGGDVMGVVVKHMTLCTSLTDPILFICLSTTTQREIVKLLKSMKFM